MIDKKGLILSAIEARKKSYAPYSNFKVGSALLTSNGKIYQGCNIECASLVKAVSDGNLEFLAIAIVGVFEFDNDLFENFASPCGVCRQYLREFCNPKLMKIILAKNIKDFQVFTLDELLPFSFGPNNLK